jgi:hypothetical protein
MRNGSPPLAAEPGARGEVALRRDVGGRATVRTRRGAPRAGVDLLAASQYRFARSSIEAVAGGHGGESRCQAAANSMGFDAGDRSRSVERDSRSGGAPEVRAVDSDGSQFGERDAQSSAHVAHGSTRDRGRRSGAGRQLGAEPGPAQARRSR